MKYCRILTSQQISTDVNNDWLSAGVISAFCETENYFYYARVRLLATNLEIRRVHKTSQAVEHFAAPLLASNSQWFTNMGGDASNRAYAQAKRLYLTPLRNGDGILWYALMRGTYYSSGQRYYSNKMSLGIFFSSGKNYRLLENDNNNQNNDYNFYILFNHVPLFNGYYSNGRAFLAVPNAFVPNTWNLSGFYPTDILCIVEDTGAQAWRYSDGPSYGNSQYGRAVWIIDDTKAVFFPITRFYNSDYSPYSSAFCCTCTFSASSGPSSYKVIGSNITYPLGSVQATSLQTGMVGWCITDEEITLMCVAGNTPGLSSNDGTHINMFTFKLEQNSASYDSVKMYPTFSSYFRFLPGYPNKKAVCYMFTNLAYEYVGLLIDITSNEAQQFICAVTPNVKAKSSTSYVWGNEEGSGAVSQIVQKNICYIVDYGQFRQYDMDNIIAEDAYNMLWTCEEDGIYKLIGVGGGAAGGSSFGGGAGYLQIATVSLVTGDQLHIKIGRGQKYSGTTVDNLIADYLSASATIVYLNEDTDPILYAAPGRGNTGGATGAATASGGGAGGYDLVQYGGQGMNYRTPTVTTSTGTTINPVPLSKDRNGGVSANTGAVTSGDGYGAGGGMNQDGKDGCLVIIR